MTVNTSCTEPPVNEVVNLLKKHWGNPAIALQPFQANARGIEYSIYIPDVLNFLETTEKRETDVDMIANAYTIIFERFANNWKNVEDLQVTRLNAKLWMRISFRIKIIDN